MTSPIAPIRVAVIGAAGRMGRAILASLGTDPAFDVRVAVDRAEIGSLVTDLTGGKGPQIAVQSSLESALQAESVDVTVDMSHFSQVVHHADVATATGASFVIGCTGLTPEHLAALRGIVAERNVPGMVVPNFAVGAVLMMKFAELAARWMPDVEIIEYHHERKEDAPSGTAHLTAQRLQAVEVVSPFPRPEKIERVEGSRGGTVGRVRVHSVRLPGLLAHQEVLFGNTGELLTIRHDSLDRSSFMTGVKLAVRHVRAGSGLTVGLDSILFEGS